MIESLGLSVLDSLLEPIAVLDQNGVIGAVNAAWRQLAWIHGGGSEAASPIGVNYLSICDRAAATPNGEEGAIAAEGIRAVMDGRRSEFHLEYPCHTAYEQRWYRMTVTRLFGSTSQVVVSHRNITHTRRTEIAARLAQAMLRQASEEDPLTDLPNRNVLMQRLDALVERCRTENKFGFALLFLEMDRFKLVNDALGHEGGDEMLMTLGQRLRDAQTAGSFAARFGDHQFVYVAGGITRESEARAAGDRLRSVLAAPYTVLGLDVRTNVSIGIAMGGRMNDARELVRQGSIALYEAKQSAHGSTMVFDQFMHDRLSRRFRIEVALRQAVPRCELSMLYQPIVDIESGRLMAVEPVLRWNSPELGSMSAGEFMPIAEEVGLGMEINEWMLRESCLQWSRWQQLDAATAPALLSMNASLAHIGSGKELLGGLRATLEGARMPAAALQIHIAERDLTANPARARGLIAGLREIGARVALNDFGTGSSSLASLRHYEFDSIKIGKSLISNIASDSLALAVAQAAIHGIRQLGMVSVAEGVDDPQILVILQTIGCAYGQGSLFARPMPADKLMMPPGRYT
ncbi:MAG TPA: EAL domain-containing protein [Steroidobacteraceae bacterium]|nr:EAL domain-containing protein [Steroidobacteraceae bacterium]